MQIVRDKVGHVVRYLFDDGAEVSISAAGLSGPGVLAADIRPADHEVVSGSSPGVFAPAAMALDGTSWSIVDPAGYAASPAVASANAAVEAFKAAIRDHIEATAQTRQYDGTVSIATYVNSTVAAWAAEAQAFIAWRDAVWGYALVEMQKALTGERSIPTIAELLAELPEMEWPT